MTQTRETVTHIVEVPVTFTYYTDSALWAFVGGLPPEASQEQEREAAHNLIEKYVDRMNERATEMFFGVPPLDSEREV